MITHLTIFRFIIERRWLWVGIALVIILAPVVYYFWHNQSTITILHLWLTYGLVLFDIVLAHLVWPRSRLLGYFFVGLALYLEILEIFGAKVISGLI